MKKPNQVRKNIKRAPASAQQKPASRRRIIPVVDMDYLKTHDPREIAEQFARSRRTIRLYVSKPFKRAIKECARREKLTVSQFIERAIREALPLIEGQL